jgi:hypothetical protein
MERIGVSDDARADADFAIKQTVHTAKRRANKIQVRQYKQTVFSRILTSDSPLIMRTGQK